MKQWDVSPWRVNKYIYRYKRNHSNLLGFYCLLQVYVWDEGLYNGIKQPNMRAALMFVGWYLAVKNPTIWGTPQSNEQPNLASLKMLKGWKSFLLFIVATTWTYKKVWSKWNFEFLGNNNRLFIVVTAGVERIGFPGFLEIPFLQKLARAELCCLQIVTVYNPVINF